MTPETFCEQFATFAEAPNGVAKLRELILQLAVQGKLGTQDSNGVTRRRGDAKKTALSFVFFAASRLCVSPSPERLR